MYRNDTFHNVPLPAATAYLRRRIVVPMGNLGTRTYGRGAANYVLLGSITRYVRPPLRDARRAHERESGESEERDLSEVAPRSSTLHRQGTNAKNAGGSSSSCGDTQRSFRVSPTSHSKSIGTTNGSGSNCHSLVTGRVKKWTRNSAFRFCFSALYYSAFFRASIHPRELPYVQLGYCSLR